MSCTFRSCYCQASASINLPFSKCRISFHYVSKSCAHCTVMRVNTDRLRCGGQKGSSVHKLGFSNRKLIYWRLLVQVSHIQSKFSEKCSKSSLRSFHHRPLASHPSLLRPRQPLTWIKIGQASPLPLNVLKWTKLLGACHLGAVGWLGARVLLDV